MRKQWESARLGAMPSGDHVQFDVAYRDQQVAPIRLVAPIRSLARLLNCVEMLVDGVMHRLFDDFRRRAARKRAEAAVNLHILGFHLLQERHRVGQVLYYRGIRLHLALLSRLS